MGVTVTEKEHWKDSITARIKKRIEAIKDEHKAVIEGIDKKAESAALKNLGIKEDYEKLLKLDEEEASAKKKAEDLAMKLYRKLRPDNSASSYYVRWHLKSEIMAEVSKVKDKLILEHGFGQEIAALEKEKENMLDTIWLATSPRQATKLWQGLLAMLGEEITGFQKEILSTKETSKA